MKKISNISFLESLYSVIRCLDIAIGILGVIIISYSIFILGPVGGGKKDMGLYCMGMVYTVPFIALILNGILNKWEKPPGRAISMILFVVFAISTAFAVWLFYILLQTDLPTPEGSEYLDIASDAFIGVVTLLFLINGLMTLRGIFRKMEGFPVKAFFSIRRPITIFIIFVVCLSILICFGLILRYTGGIRRRISPARVNIYKIKLAMYAYINAYGTYPYDPRGPDYALYQLKPFVEDVNIFRWPSIGINRIKRWRRPKPRWDDSQERVLNCDYDYLNAPDIRIEVPDPHGHLIILAEKTGLGKRGKHYMITMGFTPWYSYKEDMPKEILGKYADMSGGIHDTAEEARQKSRSFHIQRMD